MELVISVIVGLLLTEAYAWLPKISEWLVERAVSQLPAEDQVRCREEWKASLDALPNSALKLLHALSFSWAVERINADIAAAKFEQIGRLCQALVNKQSRHLQEMRTLLMAVDQHMVKLKTSYFATDEIATFFAVIRVSARSIPGHVTNTRIVNVFESLVDVLVSRFSISNAWSKQVNNQLKIIFARHANAAELFRKRKLSFTELVSILNLDDDLQTLSVMMVTNVESAEDDVREFERITTELKSASRAIREICNTQ